MRQDPYQATLSSIPNAKIAILCTKWYREHTQRMVDCCQELLVKAGAPKPVVHDLPGVVELPLAARTVARSDAQLEAIVCFGAVVKGETYHFEMIVDECMRGLGRVMLDEDIPIVVEVLPVLSIEQLIARSGPDKWNKGIEAAEAVAEFITWRRGMGYWRNAGGRIVSKTHL